MHQILKIHIYLKKSGTKVWKYILIWINSVSNFENINLFEEILYEILKIITYLKKYPGGWGRAIFFRNRPDRPWCPSNLLYNGYRVFPGGWSGWSVALTTHPHIVPRWKKEWRCTSTPPLGFCALLYGKLYLYLYHNLDWRNLVPNFEKYLYNRRLLSIRRKRRAPQVSAVRLATWGMT
jgi:hypothetical protein